MLQTQEKPSRMFSLAKTCKKVRGNNVEFSTNEITPIKARGNNLDFSTIKITSKRVGGKNVDFSTSKITSKKYAAMTGKFVEIWSSTYQRNIDVESTWCAGWALDKFNANLNGNSTCMGAIQSLLLIQNYSI